MQAFVDALLGMEVEKLVAIEPPLLTARRKKSPMVFSFATTGKESL